MVPPTIASAILNAATRQLQHSTILFAGKNLVLSKFGDELLRQINSTATQQQLTTASQSGTRPITFLPGSAENALTASAVNSTQKRSVKKKASRAPFGTVPTPLIAKR